MGEVSLRDLRQPGHHSKVEGADGRFRAASNRGQCALSLVVRLSIRPKREGGCTDYQKRNN
jgi:hypothetical protein